MTPGTGVIEVLEPGLLTTVQDLGRFGHQSLGISPAGAVDPAALILGNRLVGNPIGAAALESTLLGPTLRFGVDCWIAVTGADLGAVLEDGRPVPVGAAVPVRAGQTLRFAGGTRGCRAYVCVAGGIDVPPVLGSRATDLMGRIGGIDRGRPLRAGDRLPLGAVDPAMRIPAGRRTAWRFVPDRFDLRVVVGPQRDHFSEDALETFFGSTYTVTPASDRTGVRLAGPAVARAELEMLSEGQALGAVQIPPDGRPIVLLAGRATVGGYPKLGVVVTPDVAALAQARPGDTVRFRRVSGPEAIEVYRDWWRRLLSAEVLTHGAPDPGAPHPDVPGAPGDEASPHQAMSIPVRSPLSGIFYSRPHPHAPSFVRAGQPVAPGTVVGTVEVIKTFFDIRAGCAGTVGAIHVRDGEPVTAGETLLEIVPRTASPRAGAPGP
ncbi:MAG TPA: 5-oxoprolinase/urea amidolyase family protein [Bacillota bacterium]